jgi:anti-sigma B factor antagonist
VAVPKSKHERCLRVHGLGIQSGRQGDDHVIALEGELEMANAAAIDTELRSVEAGDCRGIVIDLRGLSFVDSTGIHMLINAYERSATLGRPLSLLVDQGPVRRVLDVCGALDILEARAIAA